MLIYTKSIDFGELMDWYWEFLVINNCQHDEVLEVQSEYFNYTDELEDVLRNSREAAEHKAWTHPRAQHSGTDGGKEQPAHS